MRSDDEITNLCIYKDRAIKRRPACNAGVRQTREIRDRTAGLSVPFKLLPCRNGISRYHKPVRSLKVVLYGEPSDESPFQRVFLRPGKSVPGPETGQGQSA
jgi:hypothetical protein